MIFTLFKREFLGYFRSPVAYVFLVVFLVASVGLSFFVGNFFKNNTASLESYFMFLPWLFLFFAPAVGMRLWAEEKRSGTLELLFTLPVTTLQTVLGKFFAAWAFLALAVFLSFPMALTAAYLGDPDWGTMFAGYTGAFLMAGSFLGICSLTSALTRNQVISFVLSVIVCFILMLLGWSVFNGALGAVLPVQAVDFVANCGLIPHYESFTKGILDPRDTIYFLSLAGLTLFLNILALER